MSYPGRFTYIKYDEAAAQHSSEFKECFEALEEMVNRKFSDGRARSLILTKMEEAYMWVGKAIRDDQITRNGGAGEG